MHEPKGRYLPLAGPRRFIGDLVHFAHRIPSAPVSRIVRRLARWPSPRARHPARPSWSCLFMKAYALVGAEHAAVAAVVAGIPLAAALRAPLDELRPGDRADLSGRRGGLRRDLPRTRAADARPAPAGGGVVQERDAGEGRLLPHGAAVQPGADADPAAPLVEHAERLGLQAVQAVRHLRPLELRCARGRADSPDLAADDHADLRPDRPGHAAGSSSS